MKIKNIFIVILLSFSFSLIANGKAKTKNKTIIHSFKLKKIINKYYKKQLIGDLRKFEKKTRPNRISGSAGHEKAIEYIKDTLSKNPCESCQFEMDKFKFDLEQAFLKSNRLSTKSNIKTVLTENIDEFKDVELKNIIWKKEGKSQNTIVLATHYDSLSIDNGKISFNKRFQAANNNSTGVTIALQILKVAASLKLEKTLMIVFLDAGTIGDQGHSQLNQYLKSKNTNVEGIMDLRMLGFDTKISDSEKRYGNMRMYWPFIENNSKNWPLKSFNFSKNKNRIKVEFTPTHNNGNFPFLNNYKKAGFPSVVFTHNIENDFDSRGHLLKNDFIEKINQKTYYKAYKYISFNLFFTLLSLQK
ncbi:MAG: hypothetical protein ACJAS4_001068 [Bacteriovoracaceae bacterium]|jgi:hypothetical protein